MIITKTTTIQQQQKTQQQKTKQCAPEYLFLQSRKEKVRQLRYQQQNGEGLSEVLAISAHLTLNLPPNMKDKTPQNQPTRPKHKHRKGKGK